MAKIVYLYQHVPKCGGRSFVHACSQWFPIYHEPLGNYPNAKRVADFARTRPMLNHWPNELFLHGHLTYDGIRPYERYGDVIAMGICRLITIVREPIERQISAFYHRRRKGRDNGDTLDQWLLRDKNPMFKSLGLPGEKWKERLDEYFLVGTTELLSLTINLMAIKTGHPQVETPHLNVSPREDKAPDPSVIKMFRQRNELDYAIYQYAVDRLQYEVAAAGLT